MSNRFEALGETATGRANDEVKVGQTLHQGVTRRLELKVLRSSSGEIVGELSAVQSASDPSRRVRTFVERESPRALEDALENARTYARRGNFGFDTSGIHRDLPRTIGRYRRGRGFAGRSLHQVQTRDTSSRACAPIAVV